MAASTAAGRFGHVSGVDVAAVVGFACLLSTLLIYSAAAMPFQRFESLPDFVVVLRNALRAGAVAGVVCTAVAALGHASLLRSLPVRIASGLLFAVGNAAFCAMALLGVPPEWVLTLVGAAMGLGCLGQLVAWARVLARYDLRRATGAVAAAAVLAALAGSALLLLSEAGAVVLFMVLTLAAAELPFARLLAFSRVSPESGAAASVPASQRLRSFLDMTLVPGLGLALFAMLMAVRGELFFENYDTYVVIQVAVAALLLVCMLLPASMPLLRAVYRGLIPMLGIAVLAFNYMSEALWGGTEFEVAAVMVLYTAAALLTLSTLAGMAHAAEFPCELVACAGVALFCLVTVATQRLCADMSADVVQVRVLIVVTSSLYAAGMAAHALWRGLRADREGLMGEGLPPAPASRPVGEAASQPGPAGEQVREAAAGAGSFIEDAGIDARCDLIARTYALTAREREVLGYLARGHNGVYISDELLISPNTVRTHIHNIYRKLDVTCREDIIRIVRG